MKENGLNARQLAQIKRIAQNVDADFQKVQKLEAKIAELTNEKDSLQLGINEMEAPVIRLTGGYKSTDIFKKTITPQFNENGTPKTDKEGRQLKVTKWVLRFEDTILPPAEAPAEVSAEDEVKEETVTETLGYTESNPFGIGV